MHKRKKRLFYFYPVFLLFLVFQVFSVSKVHCASSPEAIYLEGIRAYNEHQYDRAADLFLKVAETPVKNGELYYNIGNTFFKKGDIGRSILWYERALKLIPSDPDLLFNYQYVSGLVIDKKESISNPFADVFLFWKQKLSHRTTIWVAVFSFMIFTVFAVFRTFKPFRFLKYAERTMLVFSMIFIIAACYDFYAEKYDKKAVIISDVVSVRSGLSSDATELFRLHNGTKVDIKEELRGCVKISFSKDKIGWVEKKFIDMI